MRKRIVSLILSFVMIMGIAVVVPAAENNSEQLENAIKAVKKIITIPKEYEDFTYSFNDSVGLWSFDWSSKEDKGYISVSIDTENRIHSYNKYVSGENKSGLASITLKDGQKEADKFLKSAVEGITYKLYESSGSGNSFRYVFQRYIDDIPLAYCTFDIGVNKYTGEVNSFNSSPYAYTKINIPEKTSFINIDKAKSSYIENVGADLKYYSYYDYATKKLNVFPAYSLNDIQAAVNAVNGDKVKIYDPYHLYKNSNDEAEASAGDRNTSFSKQEMNEIEKASGLISKEKAQSKLKAAFPDTQIGQADNISLFKSEEDNRYIWNMNFENCYGSVDAETGEILYFYKYIITAGEDTKIYSYEEAKKVAEKVVNQLAPDELSQSRFDLSVESDEKGLSYQFRFVRQANGIDFVSDTINVMVNKQTNHLESFNKVWHKDITFPNIKGVIAQETAFDKITDITGFKLMCSLIDENNAQYVYDFDNSKQILIDAFSGEHINYKGEPAKENTVSKYSDISNHWCKEIVEKLLENGYYIDRDKFMPDEPITKKEFIEYLQSGFGYIEIGEEDKTDEILTRYECSMLVMKYFGYGNLLLHDSIFVNPFKDDIPQKYRVSTSVCYAFGIFTPDENGYFNGDKPLTTAEAASVIYNILNV